MRGKSSMGVSKVVRLEVERAGSGSQRWVSGGTRQEREKRTMALLSDSRSLRSRPKRIELARVERATSLLAIESSPVRLAIVRACISSSNTPVESLSVARGSERATDLTVHMQPNFW